MDLQKQDFIDAFTLLLSGAVEMKNEREMWFKDKLNRDITIEFVDFSLQKIIVRTYLNQRKDKVLEEKYKNGIKHGITRAWHIDGRKYWEQNYKNGKRHGLGVEWWYNK